MLSRSFIPVGEGMFSLERFEYRGRKVNIVYGCGTSSDIKLMQSRIEETFEAREKIDAVFITHPSPECMNGLPFLLEYCRVEKLIIPDIAPDDAALILLGYLCLEDGGEETDFFYRFWSEDPRKLLNEFNYPPEVTVVAAQGKENRFMSDIHTVSAGTDLAPMIMTDFPRFKGWTFTAYNFRQKDRIAQLENGLEKEYPEYDCGMNGLREIIKNDPDAAEKVRRAFYAVDGCFDTNSLAVFSGLPGKKRLCRVRRGRKENEFKVSLGCLYTGDCGLSGENAYRELNDALRSNRRYIGCVLLPQNGSKYCYNPELAVDGRIHIIMAGKTNRYLHPHSTVIKDLLFKGVSAYLIS